MTEITRGEIEARIRWDEADHSYYVKHPDTALDARAMEIRVNAMRAQLAQPELLTEARLDETERCARLNEALAIIHEHSAERIRKKGSYTTRALWPPFKKVEFVMPGAERTAKLLDAAARDLRIVAQCIRAGYDPRKIEPKPEERIDK